MIYYDFEESQAEAMVTTQIEYDKAVLSDELYCTAMRLTDMGVLGVDSLVREICRQNQISYPPHQITGKPAPI